MEAIELKGPPKLHEFVKKGITKPMPVEKVLKLPMAANLNYLKKKGIGYYDNFTDRDAKRDVIPIHLNTFDHLVSHKKVTEKEVIGSRESHNLRVLEQIKDAEWPTVFKAFGYEWKDNQEHISEVFRKLPLGNTDFYSKIIEAVPRLDLETTPPKEEEAGEFPLNYILSTPKGIVYFKHENVKDLNSLLTDLKSRNPLYKIDWEKVDNEMNDLLPLEEKEVEGITFMKYPKIDLEKLYTLAEASGVKASFSFQFAFEPYDYEYPWHLSTEELIVPKARVLAAEKLINAKPEETFSYEGITYVKANSGHIIPKEIDDVFREHIGD